ncbi:acyl-CoA dehydrogenase family protein [Mycobacterium montefiorense]|uniref:Acyl-CoA dehydrogenase n=1 Tax=Mycobacterium montefiorense TaxID=154654 RepID=A0AA37PLA8_9MYCO|nr:acyl-CoA dehydrogenase family protein [Mycobacterium montefiorense]GBG37525.1 putative acyl-CoA dehydrogenase [Mycobacterium montefiorense]GKU36012.1 putative acyl-CoA dehydrogenase [Mycobacterium montefiorense]GKU41616.1 putative acyl-CoA dehydrogenase [Mycobacterium montefiorense]GKU47384.1 putative acyl-CoA dehydrogenase [Mycobacterium montefiorense]GKU48756.1 putative acyl-CoA dehydrogenase [Mycobacterium montefiorense]
MDFTFTEEQETISKLARDLFDRRATPERRTELEAGQTRYDAALWKELASVDLLGTGLPESLGGNGGGFVELGVLLAEVGWSVAPVPAYATLVLGADPIARHGTREQQQRFLPDVVAGTRILTAGLQEPGRSNPMSPVTKARRDGQNWRLEGIKELVPAAQLADTVVVPASTDDGQVSLFLLPCGASGVEVRPVATTNREPHADVFLDGATVSAADRLDGGIESLYTRALVGLCAIQLGVAERALRIAAEYTSGREQFGRPIGSFQAVQQRLADAFIDVEAIRWTTWHAAWLIANGRPAQRAARIAKFWAADAGARVASTTQHVHGGIGIDVTYPLHRYFLWAKHNELTQGCATAQLAAIGSTYQEGNR